MKLTHFDEEGRSRMVDVTEKSDTFRVAVASGKVYMKPETLKRILDKEIEKGDVFGVARVAAIMGLKKTSDLIPMCHPLNITGADVYFKPNTEESYVEITVSVKLTGKTGVEMEALTGVSVAALTIYDMCKAIDKEMTISDIMLLSKSGGKSGEFKRGSL
ncbi:cyclic pyranopterin monophosphate synthase MoaC [Calditerrivibrio nitroreducens]|uniref:Cyclic pyranopterin monophosphate synthase n=1 Tax=Calditerrivibrio nitroreducens (strain DSM 19672 / NBRC 101217 / Yu37-1) TaxID=768670 RepID=E4TIU7_CALNY|nr:cyclic pyranopterin monophosphate synthase MoaC [Calditerrivibrio nitroreducens]ADR18052.1 GTP cyclohydrolase subunit MoaC [Calditerrivibrio nitroreducens DSM 19672]